MQLYFNYFSFSFLFLFNFFIFIFLTILNMHFLAKNEVHYLGQSIPIHQVGMQFLVGNWDLNDDFFFYIGLNF